MNLDPAGKRHRWGTASLAWLGMAISALGAFLSTDGDAPLHLPLLLVVIAAALAAGACIAIYLRGIGTTALSGQRERWDYEYRETIGGVGHLEGVVALGRRFIGDAHADVPTLRDRLKVNRHVLRVLTRERGRQRSPLCGYTLLYPIDVDASTRILNGEIRAGLELPQSSFCASPDVAASVYVGAILGADRNARAHIKGVLRTELSHMLSTNRNLEYVFGRPATPGGREMLERYHFVPVADENDIWMARADELQRRLHADLEYAP